MIIDAQTLLWNAAALTVSVVSDNAYDTGAAGVSGGPLNDLARGEPLVVAVAVIVAADFTTGDETYEFDLISATASDLTTGQLILAKYNVLATDLTAGTLLVLPLPVATKLVQRWLGIKAVLAGTTPTITVTAWITSQHMVQTYRALGTRIIVL